MEFTIAQSELLAGLYLTQGIVERRTTIPILGNVLIDSSKKAITVTATDQEIAVRRECVAAIQATGTLTTKARKFYEMVRELPEGEVVIRALDNNWIEVSAGHSHFRLVGMDPADFPSMPTPLETTPLRIPGEVLATMIEHTIFAVSADEARPNLNGLFLESTESKDLRVVATDGHRLAMILRPAEGTPLEQGIVIPRKAVLEIRKVLESGEDVVDLSVQGGVAHVRRGPVQMSMSLVEGEFPDYRQVVPDAPSRIVLIDTAPLLAALRRVSVVSSDRARGVKLEIEPGKMRLSSTNPDVGDATDEVDVDYDGEPITIGFNARYLIDLLGILPGGGRIELGLKDDVSPGVLRETGDPDYCYIVMPMRL